jgi:hypothetical protein
VHYWGLRDHGTRRPRGGGSKQDPAPALAHDRQLSHRSHPRPAPGVRAAVRSTDAGTDADTETDAAAGPDAVLGKRATAAGLGRGARPRSTAAEHGRGARLRDARPDAGGRDEGPGRDAIQAGK